MDGDAADIKNLWSHYTEGQAFFRSSKASNLNSYYTWRRTIRGDIRYCHPGKYLNLMNKINNEIRIISYIFTYCPIIEKKCLILIRYIHLLKKIVIAHYGPLGLKNHYHPARVFPPRENPVRVILPTLFVIHCSKRHIFLCLFVLFSNYYWLVEIKQ